MSYHILHIFRHGAMLCKDAGFILCKDKGEIVGRMAVEDLRAVIIAARGVTVSSNFLSAVLDAGAVILHCDESYKPAGITAGLSRIVSGNAAYNQANLSLKLHENLWKLVLNAKINNQISVMNFLNAKTAFLTQQMASGNPSEANCSRVYWKSFFKHFGNDEIRMRGPDSTPLNARLNYAYAVLAALLHRSILIHGLNPIFGIHHKSRPKADPLVYDLMEPLRPFVDKILIDFQDKKGGDMKEWAKFIANELKDIRVKHKKYRLKLMDSIDTYTASLAECFEKKSIKFLSIPLQ